MNISKRFTHAALCLCLAAWTLPGPAQAQEGKGDSGPGGKSAQQGDSGQKKEQEFHKAYYIEGKVNSGLPKAENPPDLETPMSTVENFLLSASDGDFDRAARSLSLTKIPTGEQAERGPELARKLFYVLNQKLWVDWADLPDRPDGELDNASKKNPDAGKPRRSILLGTINLNDELGRVAPVRIHRVKAGGQDPVWLFTPQTVENIGPLYAAYGPSYLERSLPEWAKVRLLANTPLWEWLVLLLAVALGVVAGWLISRLIAAAVKKTPIQKDDELGQVVRWPAAFFVGFLVVYLSNALLLTLPGPVSYVLDPLLLLGVVFSAAWAITRAVKFFSEYLIRQRVEGMGADAYGEQRQLLTQLSVARKVITVLAFLVAAGVVLVQFNLFETFGFSLLASAGVLSIILGIAAQPVLGNLMAGLQIAFTQPVRIGDVVVFEGEWGHVEQIAFSYLVIHTWDKRRLVVPLQYFMSHPVQNWSKLGRHLIRPIYLYVDYRIDVQKIRDRFEELLRDADLWDEEVPPQVQVTGVTEEALEVRALCSAGNATDAWNLQCELREELVKFVQGLQDGRYLPRRRLRLEPVSPRDGEGRQNNRSAKKGTKSG